MKAESRVISPKKTCRKPRVSFWLYLTDHHSMGERLIPTLQDMIAERALLASGY
ncbi:MAG: hypothetical protein HFP81_01550 [Methylococcales symbiont of Hymedesmia sp. n. MRB-2018]|nr:MAG: hypothetical protein HFP78_00870 [Methylococcales symbiont of Hymedesmia sp. n. MRB-2018]KAF3984571.1 MAG: hypothetical protein HFP81_01550 [Methylococcales symbiont of Hymedesmia sp. n. MRB-2018]